MKALILGGRGAVGRATIAVLEKRGHRAVAAGRTVATPEGIRLDAASADGRRRLSEAAGDFDAVVNAAGLEDPELVSLLPDTPLIEISATAAYLAELRDNSGPATVVLGAGIAPGVSTILAAGLTRRDDDDIDVAVMLGTGEAHGPAAVAWTAGLAGHDIHLPAEGGRVRNLRERRRFLAGGRNRLHLRADFPDHVLLARDGGKIRSYLALSSGLATAGLALVGAVPSWRGLLASAPHWGDARWEISAINRRNGEALSASGIGQSATTGEFAALAAILAAESPHRGAVTMADIADIGLLRQAESVLAMTAHPLAGAHRPGTD